ncbi:MAG: exodeoxyribonuclease VII small subunit [Geminicoccaceae bacterium]
MSEPFAGEETGPKPIDDMSFEEAMGELERIVQQLERGQLDLEASITAYERGTLLRRHCADKLKQVQLRVEKIGTDRDGEPTVTPFEVS